MEPVLGEPEGEECEDEGGRELRWGDDVRWVEACRSPEQRNSREEPPVSLRDRDKQAGKEEELTSILEV